MVAPAAPSPSSDARYRLLVILGIVLAIGLLVVGVVATNTDEEKPADVLSRPDIVEQLIPFEGAEVLRQSEIGIDLAPGYEGTLVVNDVEIPADELRLVPQQNQVFFTPGDDKLVEKLAPHTCVVAIVWRSDTGRGKADKTFRWCFDAT